MSNAPQSSPRQIAALLMQILHLPEDNSLVSLFGTGHEANNLDAMEHWVECHLHEIDDTEATMQRLQHRSRLINRHGGCHASR